MQKSGASFTRKSPANQRSKRFALREKASSGGNSLVFFEGMLSDLLVIENVSLVGSHVEGKKDKVPNSSGVWPSEIGGSQRMGFQVEDE